MAIRNYGVDFSEISAVNQNHARAWRFGMDVARTEIDNATLKREFVIWGQANGLDDMEHFSMLPDWRYMTLGRAAWLMNNGAEMPEESAAYFLEQIKEVKAKQPEVPAPKVDDEEEKSLTSDAKRVIQYVNLYSYIDAVRVKYAEDHDTIEDLIRKRIQDTQAPMVLLRKVYKHFREVLDDALAGRDNRLVAATVEPLIVVVNVLASATGNASTVNASKKKMSNKDIKAASKAKVKNLDSDTNIVGVSPVMLIGTSSALLYNTKNRKVMIYIAKAGSTLNIKGTYITDYDEELSFGKTVRKPKETFAKLLHQNPTTKRISEVLGTYIKGKRHALNGKMNKEIIIVKVIK